MSNEYIFLQGQLHLAQRIGSTTPTHFTPLGNAPAITLSLGSGALQQSYSQSTNGRPATNLSLRDSNAQPTITFDLENVTGANLAMALYGTEYHVNDGTVASEAILVNPAQSNFLSNMNLTSFTSLKNQAGTVIFTAGKDYNIDLRFGIITIPQGSAITETTALVAAYAHGGANVIHPYSTVPAPVWLRFAGINKVTNKPIMADFYKVQFRPLDSMGLIDDGAKALTLVGTILRDYHNPSDQDDNRLFNIRKA